MEPVCKGYVASKENDWWVFKKLGLKAVKKISEPSVSELSMDFLESDVDGKTSSKDETHFEVLMGNASAPKKPQYPNETVCIVLKNLPLKLQNCNRLYNLVSQCGDISKISFLRNSEDSEPFGTIYMPNKTEAGNVLRSLSNQESCGFKLEVSIFSENLELFESHFEMEDGSSSSKIFEVRNFKCPDKSYHPSKVLFLSGLSNEDVVLQVLRKFSRAAPSKVQLEDEEGVGGFKLFYRNVAEALDVLVLLNNKKVEGRTVLVRFDSDGYPTSDSPTVHTQADWLQKLKDNFSSIVIDGCSAMSREAAYGNKEIEDQKMYRDIKNELINAALNYVKSIFGGAGMPVRKDMRAIAAKFSFIYPAMFQEGVSPRALSIDDQAQKFSDRYRMKIANEKKKGGHIENVDIETPRKKAKIKQIYGVVTEKWHKAKKMSAEVSLLVANTEEERDFVKREEIFTKYREEIQDEIRKSKKGVKNICRGLFLDPRHLGNQFQYITNTAPLNDQIQKNLRNELDKMKKWLDSQHQTVEYAKKMQEIELVCQVEFNGSTTLRDLHVLVE